MAASLDRGPDTPGLAPEVGIVPEVKNVDHLVLEGVGDLVREEFMVPSADPDQTQSGRERAGGPHPPRVLNSYGREAAVKIEPVIAVEQAV